MKIAIVHDWITGMRGGEKVLEVICELYPKADLYTLVYKKGSASPIIENREIKTSFLQKMPMGREKYRHYLPLMPAFAEFLNLKNYDLVISSSHAVAKNVKTGKKALHISYIHTPMRYMWDMYDHYFGPKSTYSFPVRAVARGLRPFLRKWDAYTAKRVNHFITNSEFVGQRVSNFYHRNYSVIHPPVDIEDFLSKDPISKKDYYIVISAMVPYKMDDLVIDVFNNLKKKLVIVGDGPNRKRLEEKSLENIKFVGFLKKKDLIKSLQEARGLIYPQTEDFGIIAVESQAAGTPVIAYGKGGALETVVDGKTGIFFEFQNAESLKEALNRFEKIDWNPDLMIKNAKRFDRQVFKQKFNRFVNEKLSE